STPVRDVAADPLLAQPVIDRGVDVIDAGVEHLVENGFGLGLGDVAGTRGPTQFHRSVAQGCDLQSCPPDLSLCYGHPVLHSLDRLDVRSWSATARMALSDVQAILPGPRATDRRVRSGRRPGHLV